MAVENITLTPNKWTAISAGEANVTVERNGGVGFAISDGAVAPTDIYAPSVQSEDEYTLVGLSSNLYGKSLGNVDCHIAVMKG